MNWRRFKMIKTCTYKGCGFTTENPTMYFAKKSGGKDGLAAWCRRCSNKYVREYKAKQRKPSPPKKCNNPYCKLPLDGNEDLFYCYNGVFSSRCKKCLNEAARTGIKNPKLLSTRIKITPSKKHAPVDNKERIRQLFRRWFNGEDVGFDTINKTLNNN